MSIANSPLVKTAIAGEDANWGRVVMAVGKAGEPADRDRLDDLVRAASRGEGWRARSRLFGGDAVRLHEEHGDRDPRRSRDWRRSKPGLDLRSHPRLYRDQRRLSVVTDHLAGCRRRAGRCRWQGADLSAPGGQGDVGVVGVSRRQGRARRDAGGGADSRASARNLAIEVGARCLSPLSFVSHDYGDFHLLMPLFVARKWERDSAAAGRPAIEMGVPKRLPGLSDAAGRRAVDRRVNRFFVTDRRVLTAGSGAGSLDDFLRRLECGMSVGHTMNANVAVRKQSGVFIFLPLLIAVLGVSAIVLSQMPDTNSVGQIGYGIDERTTRAVILDGVEPVGVLPVAASRFGRLAAGADLGGAQRIGEPVLAAPGRSGCC